MKKLLTAVLTFVMMSAAASVAAQTTTVLLVRHAEKVATGGSDPELTQTGHEHAEALAAMLADVDLHAIYTTPFRRTRDTVAPVAKAKGLEPLVTDAGPGFVKELAARILDESRGRTVLVVGHSNTLGPTVAALGAGEAFELDESEYGDLFVCTIPESGPAVVLRLKAWQEPARGK